MEHEVDEQNPVTDDKPKTVPGSFQKVVSQVKLLVELIRACINGRYKSISGYTVAMAVAAVAYFYFVSPVVFAPDYDRAALVSVAVSVAEGLAAAAVVGLTIRAIQEELKKYCAFKGYSAVQYF